MCEERKGLIYFETKKEGKFKVIMGFKMQERKQDGPGDCVPETEAAKKRRIRERVEVSSEKLSFHGRISLKSSVSDSVDAKVVNR